MFEDADVISSYSRAQALEDGVLVDVTTMAREAGFRCPVAVTRAVWDDCCDWNAKDSDRKGVSQDVEGRTWDVLWMLKCAITARRGGIDAVGFQVYRVPREGRGQRARLAHLKAIRGPGDAGEQVITIMLPHED